MEEAERPGTAREAQEPGPQGEKAAASPGHRDWARLIRARLAGSVPRHGREEWMVPGLFQPGDARRLLLGNVHGPVDAAAALREAREEIGLDQRFVSVIGYLPDHVVITGFRITPVVALVQPGFELALATQEVEDTFEVPLGYLFDPANHRLNRRADLAGEQVEFREIPFGARTIWGATAGMLHTLYRVCAGPQAP